LREPATQHRLDHRVLRAELHHAVDEVRACRACQPAREPPEITDDRVGCEPQTFSCSASLDDCQQAARRALSRRDLGVLVAPPGAGKTVIACALAADHATSTLVLVDGKTLADQWHLRISEILGIKAGQFGGGRTKTRGGD
jgi:superfamily II DNA or RNA helicase